MLLDDVFLSEDVFYQMTCFIRLRGLMVVLYMCDVLIGSFCVLLMLYLLGDTCVDVCMRWSSPLLSSVLPSQVCTVCSTFLSCTGCISCWMGNMAWLFGLFSRKCRIRCCFLLVSRCVCSALFGFCTFLV